MHPTPPYVSQWGSAVYLRLHKKYLICDLRLHNIQTVSVCRMLEWITPKTLVVLVLPNPSHPSLHMGRKRMQQTGVLLPLPTLFYSSVSLRTLNVTLPTIDEPHSASKFHVILGLLGFSITFLRLGCSQTNIILIGLHW